MSKKCCWKTGIALVMTFCLSLFGHVAEITTFAQTEQLEIEQTVTGNLFYESESKHFIIHSNSDTVEWSYKNYWDEVIEHGSEKVENGRADIIVNPTEMGWFQLTVTGKTNGTVTETAATTFSVFTDFDLSQVEDSPFMVQTHAARTDEIAQDSSVLLPIANRLGVKYVRDCFLWREIEDQNQGQYDFKDYHNDFVKRLKENDLFLYATFARNNPFYDGDNSPTSEEGRKAFANYCAAVVKEYPEVVKFAEIWNEPELASMTPGVEAEQRKVFYLNLLKEVYPAVKEANSTVPVVAGALTDQDIGIELLDFILKNGAGDYMDRLSFHNYYQTIPPFIKKVDTYYQKMEQYTGSRMPMDMTEYGYTTYTGNPQMTEEHQAEELPIKMVYALANGVEKANFYNLQDKGTDLSSKEANFGLVRHPDSEFGAYTPKPAFSVYAALTRMLSGKQFSKVENWNEDLSSFLFTGNSVQTRVVWSALGNSRIIVKSSDPMIKVTDFMGTTRTYAVKNGQAIIPVASTVSYIDGNISDISFTEDVTVYEFEEMNLELSSGASADLIDDGAMSGKKGINFKPDPNHPTDSELKFEINVTQPGQYDIGVYVKKAPPRGNFQLYIDNTPIGGEQVLYRPADAPSSEPMYCLLNLGNYTFDESGVKEVKIVCTGKAEQSNGYNMMFDYLKLSYQPTEVDKTDLYGLIDLANQKVENHYSEKSWKEFAEALEKAKITAQDSGATQEEILQAITALQNGLDGLKVDKSELDSLINKAEKIETDKYTSDSLGVLSTALDQAKALFGDANATQVKVDEAARNLQSAIDRLQIKEPSQNTDPNTSDDSSSDHNDDQTGDKEDTLPQTSDMTAGMIGTVCFIMVLSALGIIFIKIRAHK